ncbi:hypothetical protein SAMN04488128_104391 [Chitinophaga eiseniae]|uniref:Uncharacterized protein n=1 Tax=Chitinophaga eiseniae TaxID=634771 RepID=A0A1T4TD25_9BACT|nr:hypothetical protein [Chitinophaga eiseniae]SKA38119.1 hypothetical protein SAMN04488128_104391 [Chitinophaga eiseniae]
MSITTIVCSPHELRGELTQIMKEEFAVSPRVAEEAYDDRLDEYFRRLKNEVQFVVEYPYVDKVYRDSYYAYFSSKRRPYQKDCIRISMFDGEVLPEHFRNAAGVAGLQERYRGFVVLRPTIPNIIGRSVVSPYALQEHRFLSLAGKYQTTVNSVKLVATGFPHASQDTEMLTCAETSLWALMEYFAGRYPEYKPVTPSVIIDTLRSRSSFRQIPSEGLGIEQMGFALREFGFGTKAYDTAELSVATFANVFSVYVESGIPLIVAVSDRHHGGRIGHAVVVMGRSETTDADIDQLKAEEEEDDVLATMMKRKRIRISDNANIKRSFVIADDNYPVYQMAPFAMPAAYYGDADWQRCEIVQFLVPLYPKVYMDALAAIKYVKTVLLDDSFCIPADTELFVRIFLASSRSYKDYLTIEESFGEDLKEIILAIPMPKFIWVGEVSSKNLIKKRKANGLIILDATEPQTTDDWNLVFGGYDQKLYCRYPEGKRLLQNSLSLEAFNIFTNNLKGF